MTKIMIEKREFSNCKNSKNKISLKKTKDITYTSLVKEEEKSYTYTEFTIKNGIIKLQKKG